MVRTIDLGLVDSPASESDRDFPTAYKKIQAVVSWLLRYARIQDIEDTTHDAAYDLLRWRRRQCQPVDTAHLCAMARIISERRCFDYIRRRNTLVALVPLEEDWLSTMPCEPFAREVILKAALEAADETRTGPMLELRLDAWRADRNMPSVRQMAEELGMSHSWASVLLNRFLKRFEAKLSELGFEVSSRRRTRGTANASRGRIPRRRRCRRTAAQVGRGQSRPGKQIKLISIPN